MEAQDIADLLRNVNPLPLWGMAIHKAIADPTPERMEQLIKDLRSQAKDNPQMMRDILGGIIYEKLGLQA